MSPADAISSTAESATSELLDQLAEAAKVMDVPASAILSGVTAALLQFMWDGRKPGTDGDQLVAKLHEAAGTMMPMIERPHMRSVN